MRVWIECRRIDALGDDDLALRAGLGRPRAREQQEEGNEYTERDTDETLASSVSATQRLRG